MSAQRRAANKRRGSASARRGDPNGKNLAPPADAESAVAATATVEAAPEKQSRLTMPGRSSRPPMPEKAKPPRPPMPEKPKTTPETANRVVKRFDGIQRWYLDTMSEARKIVWPDRETTKNLTIVVIGISVVLGILLGGIDFVLQRIFEALP
jgi:preprotein translocase subunit SecE